MNLAAYLALMLLQLTGPEGQVIYLDADKVATLREPRAQVAPGIKCLIFTVDGKNISVVETCAQVREMLLERKSP